MKEEKTLINNEFINLFNREKLEIKGALEIVGSSEKDVLIKMEKQYLHIIGEGLIIVKLIPEEKILCITGKIESLNFQDKHTKKSILKKVFK